MENVKKNVDTTKNLTPFTSEYQPTPEAKKKGWEKRRAKQEVMDLMDKLKDISMKDLEDLRKDIKDNPDKHTVLEARMIQYTSKEKFLTDFLDRYLGKAPQNIDLTTDGEKIDGSALILSLAEEVKTILQNKENGTGEGKTTSEVDS